MIVVARFSSFAASLIAFQGAFASWTPRTRQIEVPVEEAAQWIWVFPGLLLFIVYAPFQILQDSGMDDTQLLYNCNVS